MIKSLAHRSDVASGEDNFRQLNVYKGNKKKLLQIPFFTFSILDNDAADIICEKL